MAEEGRISRHSMYMEIAHTVAKRSTCMRLNVGAVMVHERSIVSMGYNGAPSGEPHCGPGHCLATSACRRTIHAEVNALERAPVGLRGLDLYVTHSPCVVCWDRMWGSGRVNRVFFGAEYRETQHLVEGNLFEMGIYRVLPSGLVVDWITREVVDVQN